VGIDEGQVQACGANGAMIKPFDTQEMLEKVTALAQGKTISSGKPAAAPRVAPQPVAPAARPAPIASSPVAPSPVAARPAPHAPAAPSISTPKPVASTPAARPAAASISGSNKQFPAAFASGEDMA